MSRRYVMSRQVRVVATRYPFLGPLLYVLSLQFFIVQSIVAAGWSTASPYSFVNNVISDLGNSGCGQYGASYVCSPGHDLMNISFVVLGLGMLLGSALVYQEFKRSRLSFIAFTLLGLGGVGTALVGIFPENTIGIMHGIGAFLALGIGNLAILLLAFAVRQARPLFRIYTGLTGAVTLLAFGLFLSGNYLGLGAGGMERLAGHPQTIWLTLLGLYMTATRLRR